MQHLDFVTEQGGEYSFCFDNRPTPPTTGVDVHAVPSHRLDVSSRLAKGPKLSPLSCTSVKVQRKHTQERRQKRQTKRKLEGEEKTPS